MKDQLHDQDQKLALKTRKISVWLRLTAILFRILIILGLILLVLLILVLIFTSQYKLWILILPFALITLGIIIARIEYRLHRRLNPEEK